MAEARRPKRRSHRHVGLGLFPTRPRSPPPFSLPWRNRHLFPSSVLPIYQPSLSERSSAEAEALSHPPISSLRTTAAMNGAAPISAVILDLDGTLLDTERATGCVLKEFLARYGKVLDPEKEDRRLGKMHKESAAFIVVDYELPLTGEEYSRLIMPMYQERWPQAKALPGANRLIRHLHKHRVPFALASNSIRKHIDIKISYQKDWNESFSVILGADEVDHGKPSPDMFLEAAKRMGVNASRCLVIEDSLVGVTAAKAAGMQVVAVPSLPGQTEHYAAATCVLHTLLEFQPDLWGLPTFDDWIQNSLPIEPLYVRGLFCEGVLDSPVLIDESAENNWSASLPNQLSGVFFGWAKLGTQGMLKVVMSIHWDISSGGVKRLIKPHLVSETCKNALGKQLLVMVIGYIRKLNEDEIEDDPETTLAVTEEDKNIARAVLDLPMFAEYKSDPCFADQSSGIVCCSDDC